MKKTLTICALVGFTLGFLSWRANGEWQSYRLDKNTFGVSTNLTQTISITNSTANNVRLGAIEIYTTGASNVVTTLITKSTKIGDASYSTLTWTDTVTNTARTVYYASHWDKVFYGQSDVLSILFTRDDTNDVYYTVIHTEADVR